MSILRILGRPSSTIIYNVSSARYYKSLGISISDTNSVLRQREILMNYYRMCDIDERHQTVQVYSTKTKLKWLREYHRKQDIDNRMLEAGFLKYDDK